MSRPTATRLVANEARCRVCSWHAETANAQGIAAKHHDREHHQVVVTTTREVVYGDASSARAAAAQTAIPLTPELGVPRPAVPVPG